MKAVMKTTKTMMKMDETRGCTYVFPLSSDRCSTFIGSKRNTSPMIIIIYFIALSIEHS